MRSILIITISLLFFVFIDYEVSLYNGQSLGLVKKKLPFHSSIIKFPEKKYSLYDETGYPIILCTDEESRFPVSSPNQKLNANSGFINIIRLLKICNDKNRIIAEVETSRGNKFIIINKYKGDSIISDYVIMSSLDNVENIESWIVLSKNNFFLVLSKFWRFLTVLMLIIIAVLFLIKKYHTTPLQGQKNEMN